MKRFRYILCSILLFFNDNWLLAKNKEEAEEFYEKFHNNDTIY